MKISDLIKELESAKAKHGDIEAVIDDADEGSLLTIQEIRVDAREKCVKIGGDYNAYWADGAEHRPYDD